MIGAHIPNPSLILRRRLKDRWELSDIAAPRVIRHGVFTLG